MGEGQALESMKMMQAEPVDAITGVLVPFVEGHDQTTRLAIYAVAYAQCLNGMRSG